MVRDDKWWEITKKERARLYLSFVRADRFRHLLNAYVAKKQFGKPVDQLSEKEKILLYGIVLDGVAGANGVDAFAQEISKMISIEEGEKNTPNISVIKSVLNKSYPLPYK